MNQNTGRSGWRGCSGFTIVELLAVVAIIGILAAIALPSYMGAKKRAKQNAVQLADSARSELSAWLTAAFGQRRSVSWT